MLCVALTRRPHSAGVFPRGAVGAVAGLLLPTYATRERLKDRLFLAMEHGKGFGLA